MEQQQDSISIDQVIDSTKIGKPQILLSIIFVVLHGTEMADLGAAILLGAVLQCDWGITRFQSAMIVTTSYMGMLLGSVLWGVLGDRLGRRDLLIVTNTAMFFTCVLIALSPTIGWILFLRTILGFLASGAYTSSASLITELFPQRFRGKSMTLMFFGTSIGLLTVNLVFCFGYPVLGWRWVIFIIALPTLIVSLCVLFYVPRSPRFLHLSNQYDAAIESLRFLSGSSAGNFIADNKVVTAARTDERGNLLQVFNAQHWFTTVLMMIVFFGVAFTQIGALNVVVYLPSQAHRCPLDPSRSSSFLEQPDNSCCPVINSTTFANAALAAIGPIVFTIATLFMIDWIGRKKSIMLFTAIGGVSIMCLDLCQPLGTIRLLMALSTGAVEALFACAYVYVGEYYPTSIRASAYGVCFLACRSGYILGVYPAQMLMSLIGTFLVLTIYGIVMVTVFVSAILLPVETMGRRLTQTSEETVDCETSSGLLKSAVVDKYDTFSDKVK